MLRFVCRRVLGATACAVLTILVGSVSVAHAGNYMLIDSARLASLPTTGAPYTDMKKTADDAMASAGLSSPTPSSPWLPNYGGMGAETLAAALVYARTGDVRYRDFVIRMNRFLIGSEDSTSTNGTAVDDRLLATMRQISAYIMAADLVGMDPNVTGSRSGYTSTVWKTWLGALRTKTIGTSSKPTIVAVNDHATNWGAWASAARISIDLYINDPVDLALAVGRLKLYLGESFVGTPWIQSSSFDSSWACVPSTLSVSFVPVNPSSCGPEKDGVIVEDASRSAFAFPTWDNAGIDYSFHAYSAQLVAALMLSRQGYDVWNWGDQAMRRIMDRLDRLGKATGNGSASATHVSWIPRYFYGKTYPTVPAQAGNTLGFTDWLFTGSVTSPPPPEPTIGLLMGDATAGTVWTALTTDRKRASRFSVTAPSAKATAVQVHMDGKGATTGSQPVRAVIYSDSSGAPGTLVASSNTVTVSAGQAAGLVTLSLPSSVALATGSYWVGLHSGGTTAVARYAATSVTNALRYGTKVDAYADGASGSFGASSLDNKQMSISVIGTQG